MSSPISARREPNCDVFPQRRKDSQIFVMRCLGSECAVGDLRRMHVSAIWFGKSSRAIIVRAHSLLNKRSLRVGHGAKGWEMNTKPAGHGYNVVGGLKSRMIFGNCKTTTKSGLAVRPAKCLATAIASTRRRWPDANTDTPAA
jgi:hypothetical protein